MLISSKHAAVARMQPMYVAAMFSMLNSRSGSEMPHRVCAVCVSKTSDARTPDEEKEENVSGAAADVLLGRRARTALLLLLVVVALLVAARVLELVG